MRQSHTYALPSPWRQLAWLYAALAAGLVLGLLADCAVNADVVTAHAGQVKSDFNSTRRLRKETRISVLRPIRARGRAAAGYPFLQTAENVTRIGVNLSGLFNPIAWFF